MIGLAAAAVSRCRPGTLLHAEAAWLHGAPNAEVTEAVHYANLVSGWSIYLNGLQVDDGVFADQIDRMVAFLGGDTGEGA